MNTIRFEFICSRPVPLYSHLCNHYLSYSDLDVFIGHELNNNHYCYFLETVGEQAPLEKLADAIANDFLISVWLTDSNIRLIDNITASKKLIKTGELHQEYCHQCTPQFGDNQSANFGELNLTCDFCHGEQQISPEYIGFTKTDITSLCDDLLTQGSVTIPGVNPICLSVNPITKSVRPRLLICNPNTLNAQFYLSDHQVLALSSIEKPSITTRAIKSHPKLNAPLYDLCFASNRLLIIISEYLRQRGVDWLFFHAQYQDKPLAFINDHWAEVCSYQTPTITFNSNAKALHDQALIINEQGHYLASNHKQTFKLETTDSLTNLPLLELTAQEYALCALYSINIEHKLNNHCALVYFSEQHGGQIQTIAAKGETELFFALPSLPPTGYDIYHQLEQSPQKQVLEKFKQQFPEDYLNLLNLKLPENNDNLTSLWAVAAVLLGLESQSLTPRDLSDALIASAMSHRGHNAPRIDYPLTKGEAYRSLNWCKTLGTVMSFRLADDSDKAKIAFGMQDSLADYLTNWIEHLDQNIGIKSVNIAGNEWSNPVLSQRFCLRVGKNFTIYSNQQLAIDSNNYAMGALLLKKRRK